MAADKNELEIYVQREIQEIFGCSVEDLCEVMGYKAEVNRAAGGKKKKEYDKGKKKDDEYTKQCKAIIKALQKGIPEIYNLNPGTEASGLIEKKVLEALTPLNVNAWLKWCKEQSYNDLMQYMQNNLACENFQSYHEDKDTFWTENPVPDDIIYQITTPDEKDTVSNISLEKWTLALNWVYNVQRFNDDGSVSTSWFHKIGSEKKHETLKRYTEEIGKEAKLVFMNAYLIAYAMYTFQKDRSKAQKSSKVKNKDIDEDEEQEEDQEEDERG